MARDSAVGCHVRPEITVAGKSMTSIILLAEDPFAQRHLKEALKQ